MENKEINKILFCIGGVLNLIATSRMPREFYLFLKIFNSLMFVSLMLPQYRENKKYFFVTSFMLLILYNPVEQIRLDKDVWMFFNLVTTAYFAYLAFQMSNLETKRKKDKLTEYQKSIIRLKQ